MMSDAEWNELIKAGEALDRVERAKERIDKEMITFKHKKAGLRKAMGGGGNKLEA